MEAHTELGDRGPTGCSMRPSTVQQVHFVAGWSSPVAREAHNLEVAGSNPAPATIFGRCDWFRAESRYLPVKCWFSHGNVES